MNVSAAGMAWYERQNYPAIQRLMADGHLLPRTYDEWLRRAEGIERDLQRKGHRIMRVSIQPDLFVAWCRDHGLETTMQARSRYAGDYVYMSMLEGS